MRSALPDLPPMIGEAPSFLSMLEHVSRAAPLVRPVLVLGERGTGKEHIAARLHYLSSRWEQPLVKLNCAALTETLLESELFGHEAGSFTGATGRRIGRFEQADGGTLVLDELGTIPLRMQEQILRVIEYGEFQRVGGSETRRTDVRVVGATNADLLQAAEDGSFRRDLLDRLAFDVIHVPPLRARREDILPLAEHFAINMTAELKREIFAGFTAQACHALLSCDWPGNVRELKNTVERSVYRAVAADEPIDEIAFDPFAEAYPALPANTRHRGSPTAEPDTDARAPGSTRRPGAADPPAEHTRLPVDLKAVLARTEVGLIEEAMQQAAYLQPRAAELLGLSYHQLRAALRRHDLVERFGRARGTPS
ncbi:MAG: phage shock protein operon transcriptional activator [Gammaproteobacteria bacterium]|nr:MAG: phage shock protein operon transcriptional activator [Gammaproteobacteria bacterium]